MVLSCYQKSLENLALFFSSFFRNVNIFINKRTTRQIPGVALCLISNDLVVEKQIVSAPLVVASRTLPFMDSGDPKYYAAIFSLKNSIKSLQRRQLKFVSSLNK
jgi:hypothetical protein